jgi:hypothetical protein
VGSPEIASTHHKRPDSVAPRLQVADDLIGCGSADTRNVLSDNPSRSELADDPHELRPEVSLVFDSSAGPGDRVRLTGETPCHNVN